MTYLVLGRNIEIYSIVPGDTSLSHVYEVKGSPALGQIGLSQKFWFQLPDNYSNDFPETEDDFTSQPKFLSQRVLAGYLAEAILEKGLQ